MKLDSRFKHLKITSHTELQKKMLIESRIQLNVAIDNGKIFCRKKNDIDNFCLNDELGKEYKPIRNRALTLPSTLCDKIIPRKFRGNTFDDSTIHTTLPDLKENCCLPTVEAHALLSNYKRPIFNVIKAPASKNVPIEGCYLTDFKKLSLVRRSMSCESLYQIPVVSSDCILSNLYKFSDDYFRKERINNEILRRRVSMKTLDKVKTNIARFKRGR